MSAPAFTILAILLAGPVPALLSRASWPLRAPRAAIVLWQSIAVAAVLSAFSAGLAIAASLFAPGPNGRPSADITEKIAVLGWPLWLIAVAGLLGTMVIGVRLIMTVLRLAVDIRRRRSRHRMVVDLVGECPMEGVRVLQVREPLAYCLPGVRSRVVLSSGTLDNLSDTELTAVLRHERAHLRARHDLVLEAFTAVHTAFPRFVRSGNALNAVGLLIETLADDAAVRVTGPRPLARALVMCAAGHTPRGAMAAGGPTTVIRVQRLAGAPNSTALSLMAYLAAATVLVIPTLAVAIPWLTELQLLFPA